MCSIICWERSVEHSSYVFIKLTIVKWSTKCYVVSYVVQQWTTKEIEIEFTTYRSWRKYIVSLEGPHREIKAECRKRQDMEHMSLLVFLGESQAKAGLVNSNQRSRVLENYTGILSKGYIKEKVLGGRGETWSKELLVKLYQELNICLWVCRMLP